MQLTHTSLADARKELKNIDPALATRLAMQSLQAIHDFHLYVFKRDGMVTEFGP